MNRMRARAVGVGLGLLATACSAPGGGSSSSGRVAPDLEDHCPDPVTAPPQPDAGYVLQRGPGCTELWLDGRINYPVVRPKNVPLLASGDATEAQLTEEGWDEWYFSAQLDGEPFGLPTEVMEAVLGNTPIDEVHAVFETVESVWKTGLVHIPGEFYPRGLVEITEPEPLVTQNCSACHSGVVKGQLIGGVGNKWYNQRAIIAFARGVMADGLPDPGVNDELRARVQAQLDRLDRYDALYGNHCDDLAPGMITGARIWEISAKLLTDPAQLEDPAQMDRFRCGATKPPPLNTVRFRNMLFWDGAVTTLFVTHWPMFDFFGFDDYAHWERKIATRSIQAMDTAVIFHSPSPTWESVMGTPLDQAAAARGFQTFHAANSCASCHGTYAADGMLESFAPAVTPLPVIGTDTERAYAATDETLAEFTQYDWVQVPRLDHPGSFPLGYANSPLCSPFLSFPYLHTAGVANLMELLTAEDQRSHMYWQSDITDDINVGYLTTATPPDTTGMFPPPRVLERTFRPELVNGHSGGPFGTELSGPEKVDLLEYVKSLHCPD